MSVLKGEGRNVILYESTAIPIGRSLPAYLARPDLRGAHPVVLVAHGGDGVTSSVKALCRRIARHGMAVVCPDLGSANGEQPAPDQIAADLQSGFDFAVGSGWGSMRRGAVLGLGGGGASVLRRVPSFAERIVVVGAPLGSPDEPGTPAAALASIAVPLLGLYGADDRRASADEVRAAAGAAGEWVIYPGAAEGFHDEGSNAYEPEAAEDAVRRMLQFLVSA